MKTTQAVILPKVLLSICKQAGRKRFLTATGYIKQAIVDALLRDGFNIEVRED